MTDAEIETMRVAGDITLILKDGTPQEKESLLKAIELVSGVQERERLEDWLADGMPGA